MICSDLSCHTCAVVNRQSERRIGQWSGVACNMLHGTDNYAAALCDFLAALREVKSFKTLICIGSVVILVPFNVIAQVCRGREGGRG